MKIISLLFFSFSMTLACFAQTSAQKLDRIFNTTYWHSIISKGDNLPDFDRRKDNIDRFLVSLFEDISPEDFMEKAGWTNDMFNEKVKLLIEKGWLKKDGDKLYPTVFIVSEPVGKQLYEYALPLANEIAGSIEEYEPFIREKFVADGLGSVSKFKDLSFLILSDGLLDNWQIMKVESAFLKQENRPERHGKYYYAAILEISEKEYEPFRIYGNQSGKINDSTWLNIYGNNRISANKDLQNREFCDSVMANALTLTTKFHNFFEETASAYHPKLIKILEDNREYSMDIFKKAGYSDKIRFEEFFIWWYHFIYTEATNILAEKNILTIPLSGNFFYR